MSDDEFDNIPDDFADVQSSDWPELLAGQNRPVEEQLSPHVESIEPTYQTALLLEANDSVSSSNYFSDNDDMDASFLAELDRIEERLTGRTQETYSVTVSSGAASRPDLQVAAAFPSHSDDASLDQPFDPATPLDLHQSTDSRGFLCFADKAAGTSSSSRLDTKTSGANPGPTSNLPCKRPRSEDYTISSPKRKGKMKAEDRLTRILSLYEDELTCPICCDILAACYVGNPCGHSFCGECGWQWHVQKGNKGCPCCRGTLDERMPMVPNIAMDNTVEKHIKALALSGESEWEPSGRKFLDWDAKKQAWRKGASKREAKKLRQLPKPVTLGAIQVIDLPPNWFEFEENLEDDRTYEDSDVELIPRPMQRVRRRRRRVGR